MGKTAALSCPALLIAGCASGPGKTTVTAALARYHARFGRRVRVFKTGPDFIDPTILEAASGAHSFHYSRLDTPLEPAWRCTPHRSGTGECVFRHGAITASYLHAYFPTNPAAAAALLLGAA